MGEKSKDGKYFVELSIKFLNLDLELLHGKTFVPCEKTFLWFLLNFNM